MNPAEVVIGGVQAARSPQISNFLEEPFVNRVNRRICILIVKFSRSTMLVQIRAGPRSWLQRTFQALPKLEAEDAEDV